MKKVLITGANGYLGSGIVKSLLEKDCCVYAADLFTHRLDGINSDKLVIIKSSVDSLEKTLNPADKFDCLIHCAWEGSSGTKRQDYLLQLKNIELTFNAYKLSEKLKCKKFVSLGTITEKVSETIEDNLEINSLNLYYGAAKSSARMALEIASRQSETQFVWVRLSNVFGGNNDTGNIIGYTLGKILNGEQALFSSANQIYDLIYYKDCIEAISRIALEVTNRKLYFVGSGTPRILKEYLTEIGNIAKKPELIKIGAREEDGIKYKKEWFDTSALNELGFKCKYSFTDAIKQAIEEMKG